MTVANSVLVAAGDSSNTTYQLLKRRTVGAVTRTRDIKKVALDASSTPIIRCGREESGVITELTRVASGPAAGQFSVDVNTGIVTTGDVFTGAQSLYWSGEFDVPVRFDVDILEIQMIVYETGSVPPITLQELRIA